jgi:glycosyltransferase involved in cell wall biosynthesis
MVSIVIPYIDEFDYLVEAITTARHQQGVEIEIIVVCNAAGEQVLPDEIKKLADGMRFIHEPLRGSAYARNTGLQHALGEWVQFLDVDDILEKDKIQVQACIPDADVVVSPHAFRFLTGKVERSKWLPDDLWVGMLNSGLGSTSSMLFKRQALQEIGGWNTSYHSHQEYELLFRMAEAGKRIKTVEKWQTIVRQRKEGSITMTSKAWRAKEGIQLRETMWNYLKLHGLDTPERFEAFRQYIFRQLRGLYRQDREQAMKLFQQYFTTTSFAPRGINVPGYSLFYRLFGFHQTESFILFCKRFLSSHA